jgi:hypothetical protein
MNESGPRLSDACNNANTPIVSVSNDHASNDVSRMHELATLSQAQCPSYF